MKRVAVRKESVLKLQAYMLMRRVCCEKAGWLGCEFRQLSEILSQVLPPFIFLKNFGGILQIAFWFPGFVGVSFPFH